MLVQMVLLQETVHALIATQAAKLARNLDHAHHARLDISMEANA
jgi:hypothetical protein